MNEITQLSYGGPGSGRYPKGSDKKKMRFEKIFGSSRIQIKRIKK